MLLFTRSTTRLISLCLLSMGGLLLEITLTRLFSAIFTPPYVYAILSLAVLGIGLGAAVTTAFRGWRRDDYLPLYLICAGVAAFALGIFLILPVGSGSQLIVALPVTLPYVFLGLTLSTLFSNTAANSTRLYMADLVGAGLGAIIAVPLLDTVGPINGILIVPLLFGLAALGLRPTQPRKIAFAPFIFLLAGILVLASNVAFQWLRLNPATISADKPIRSVLDAKGRVIQTVWNSFARTDLVDPGDGTAYRVYLDGAAGSVMPPANSTDLQRDIGFFPFATAQPQHVIVIGPGGGLDVWFALQSKAADITAVEVNPASVALVRDYGQYNGNLYQQPQVHVVVDEGRSLLRREGKSYDLIFLSQVVTLAAERTGYSLTENTIYTTEAFQDYLSHLTPDGEIALKLYDEITLTRALSTVLAALRQQGLSDAQGMQQIAAFVDPRGQPPIPLLIIRKKPFSHDDALAYAAVAKQVGYTPLYLPGVVANAPLDAVEAGTRTFADIVEQSSSDISPTTDDRPFFYQFDRGLPSTLTPLLAALFAIVVGGTVALVLWLRQRKVKLARWSPLYFAGLGTGYMLIEIALIQQARLFLSHPTLAVTSVLAVLLVGGGIGSWAAGTLTRIASPTITAVGVAVLALLYIVTWPVLSQVFLTAPVAVRILVMAVNLTPLALLMGMPFPLGLQAIGKVGASLVALGWAVNGLMTVVASVGAMAMAILFGFQSVLFAGLIAYLLVAALSRMGVLRR